MVVSGDDPARLASPTRSAHNLDEAFFLDRHHQLAVEDEAARSQAAHRGSTSRWRASRPATSPAAVGAVRLSPATRDRARAGRWFRSTTASLDGVMAKRLDSPYRLGERDAMVKVKKLRTADCMVGGFRYRRDAPEVGSLLLGLYDGEGVLHHVGFTSSLDAAARRELTPRLEALRDGATGERGFSGGDPGAPSRWAAEGREWGPLPPELVAEVVYDHFSGGRFRHGTRLLRFRPDKPPADCTFEQVPHGARLAPLLAEAAAG